MDNSSWSIVLGLHPTMRSSLRRPPKPSGGRLDVRRTSWEQPTYAEFLRVICYKDAKRFFDVTKAEEVVGNEDITQQLQRLIISSSHLEEVAASTAAEVRKVTSVIDLNSLPHVPLPMLPVSTLAEFERLEESLAFAENRNHLTQLISDAVLGRQSRFLHYMYLVVCRGPIIEAICRGELAPRQLSHYRIHGITRSIMMKHFQLDDASFMKKFSDFLRNH